MKEERIDQWLSRFPASEEPFSADVGIVRGNGTTWLLDMGNGEAYVKAIEELPGPKAAILSHFHPDHAGNADRLPQVELYAGANTLRYTKRGIPVTKDLLLEDGVRLRVLPLPSSHAKGSLAVEINETYVWIGDGAGPAIKPQGLFYNAQVLLEEIRTLENLKAPYVLQSHRLDRIERKDEVLNRLRSVYSLHRTGEPWIAVQEE